MDTHPRKFTASPGKKMISSRKLFPEEIPLSPYKKPQKPLQKPIFKEKTTFFAFFLQNIW